MTATRLTADAARTALGAAIHAIVPDADLGTLADEAPLRSELELDSLDFLALVEHLSGATGVRIEESDYPDLISTASIIAFLTARSDQG